MPAARLVLGWKGEKNGLWNPGVIHKFSSFRLIIWFTILKLLGIEVCPVNI